MRRCRLRADIAALLLLLSNAACGLGQRGIAADTNACRGVQWVLADSLSTADGRRAYTEAPFGAQVGRGLMLFGTPTFVWQSRSAIAVPKPDGSYDFSVSAGVQLQAWHSAQPIAAPVDAKMLWHKGARLGDTVEVMLGTAGADWSRGSLAAAGLWHARYLGSKWMEVRQLPLPPGKVAVSTSADLVVAGEDLIGVALVSDSLWFSRPTIIRRRHRDWALLTPFPRLSATYATIARTAKGTLILAYTASDSRVRDENGTHVFVARSTDNGDTWGEPVRVHWSGLGASFEVRVFDGDDGAVHVAWLQRDAELAAPTAIQLASSSDDGFTWRESGSLNDRVALGGLRVVWDHRRAVNAALITAMHLHTDSLSGEPGGSIVASVWRPGMQEPLRSLALEEAAPYPSIVLRDGIPHLLWGVVRPSRTPDGEEPAPVTMIARAAPCRPPA